MRDVSGLYAQSHNLRIEARNIRDYLGSPKMLKKCKTKKNYRFWTSESQSESLGRDLARMTR